MNNLLLNLFKFPIKIYWEDTDAGGIVFYANYVKFYERARSEWLLHLGIDQRDMIAQNDAMFIAVNTALYYQKPVRLFDQIEVHTSLCNIGGASLSFKQSIWRDETMVGHSQTKIGCVSHTTLKPMRLPANVLKIAQGQFFQI